MCIDYIFVDAQRHLQWLKEMSKGVGLPAFDFTGGSGGAVGGLSGGRGAGGLTTGGTGGLTTGGTGGLAGGTGGVKTGGVGGLKTGGTGGLKAGGAGGRKTGGPGGLTVRGGGGGLTNGGTGGLTVTGGTGGLTVTGGAAGGLAGAGAGGFPYIICTMRIGKLGLIDNQKVFPPFFFLFTPRPVGRRNVLVSHYLPHIEIPIRSRNLCMRKHGQNMLPVNLQDYLY